jgi:histidine ammonia-lyase
MLQICDKLTLRDIWSIVENNDQVAINEQTKDEINRCFTFLDSFSKDKVIYGINTGFGPMAQWRIDDDHLNELQYNIIRSHSTGAGEPLPQKCVRAAMLARLMTFMQAHSGVNIQTCELLVEFLNRGIYPVIPQHGSVGASGDLVQLAHIALALIGEGEVFYEGVRRNTAEVFAELGIKPLQMYVREGLAVTNGTAVMTGIGFVNLFDAKRLLDWSLKASVLMNEIASSYDDLMSEVLNGVKRHSGQQAVAAKMREISSGSQMLLDRVQELYHKSEEDVFEHKVQPYYSLRCIPQILGPIWDAIENVERVLVNEINSADDNPIVDPQNKTVIHGGNFHGDYVSFEMDKLRLLLPR